MSKIPVILALLMLTSSCGEEAAAPPAAPLNFSVEATVQTDSDVAVPNVAITLNGKIVGRTDADGKFSATLTEVPGESVTLGAIAPDGYRIIKGEEVSEQLKTATLSGTVSGVPVFLATTLESLKKDYFIWVKTGCGDHAAECAGWPVMVDGVEMTKTNSLGYANFSFTREPYTDVEVTIQTPGAFVPANPTYAVSLEANATVYRLEQQFKDPTRKKVVRRAAPVKRTTKKATTKKKTNTGLLPLTPSEQKRSNIDLF